MSFKLNYPMSTNYLLSCLVCTIGLALSTPLMAQTPTPLMVNNIRKDTLLATGAYEKQVSDLFQSVRGKQVSMLLTQFNQRSFGSEGGKREQLSAQLQNYARYLEQEYKGTTTLTLLEKEVVTSGQDKILILRFRVSDGQRSSLLSLNYSLTDKSILSITLPFEVENYRY